MHLKYKFSYLQTAKALRQLKDRHQTLRNLLLLTRFCPKLLSEPDDGDPPHRLGDCRQRPLQLVPKTFGCFWNKEECEYAHNQTPYFEEERCAPANRYKHLRNN